MWSHSILIQLQTLRSSDCSFTYSLMFPSPFRWDQGLYHSYTVIAPLILALCKHDMLPLLMLSSMTLNFIQTHIVTNIKLHHVPLMLSKKHLLTFQIGRFSSCLKTMSLQLQCLRPCPVTFLVSVGIPFPLGSAFASNFIRIKPFL